MKNVWRWVLGVVTLALVIYLLRKVNFNEVWTLLRGAHHWYLLLAFAIYGASIFVLTSRFKYFLDPLTKSSYYFLLKNSLMGFFIGTITPATQMGGDPVRAHYVGKRYKLKRSRVFGAVLADRFYHALVSFSFILLSGFFALTFLPLSSEIKLVLQTVLFFIIFSIVLFFVLKYLHKRFNLAELFSRIMPFLRRKKVKRRKPKSQWKKVFMEHFGNFSSTFKEEVMNKELITIGISFSVVYWLLNFAVSYLLFIAFGHKVSFFLVMLVFNVGILIGEFSPTPGGVGLIEGGTFFVYSLAGINTELALAVALISRVIFYVYSLALGGLSLISLENEVDKKSRKTKIY